MSGRHLKAVGDSPRRVVLYVRVSSLMGRGGDDFHSPDVQLSSMRRATATMREVAVIDDDIDQTGRTFERSGIAKIRQLVELGSVDALAVYNISRFGRNVLESLKFLNWLADRGVTILSATEHIDTSTPSGRWMLTNMLAIAEMRSDEIGVEWSRTIQHRSSTGRPHGRPPTGYVRAEDGKLAPDPVLGPAVAQAFAQYATGLQLRVIRRNLQTATGLMLATSTVKKMLANKAYLGTVHSRGKGGLVEVPNAHQALVDEVTWRRVDERLARDSRIPARLVTARYALSGLGRCGSCEGPLNHRPEPRQGVVRIFCRRQWEALGDRCPGCGALNVDDVERVVLEKIRVHIAELRSDVGAQAAREAQASRANLDAVSVEGELTATRKAMARATERWARGQLDDRTYDDAMGSLRGAEARLTATLGELGEAADVPEAGTVVALSEKLLELWPQMDSEQRNRALRDVVKAVVVSRGEKYRQPADVRVTVDWR